MNRLFAREALARRHLRAAGPTWDASARVVRWVDAEAGEVLWGRTTPGGLECIRSLRVDGRITAAVPASDATLSLAIGQSLWRMWPDGHRSELAVLLQPDREFSHSGVDPSGRLCLGTRSVSGPARENMLIRLEHDGEVTYLDEDLGAVGGIAWSPDARTMHVLDSGRRVLWNRPYDPVDGRSEGRVRGFELDDEPDALAVDAEGGLWIGLPHGVLRASAAGEPLASVETPSPVSGMAFVGERLDALLVATAAGTGAGELLRIVETGQITGAPIPPHDVG